MTTGANPWVDTTSVIAATPKKVRKGKQLTPLLYPTNKKAWSARPLMVLLGAIHA